MKTGPVTQAIEILLVEDNPGDVLLTREALKDAKILANLHVARNGVEAVDFLFREGRFKNVPRPDLILLDLNLPLKSGTEVLSEIKVDDNLKTIPVVILTTSQSEKDIMQSYQNYANCYINKPVELEQFIDIVRSIEDFWFHIVRLPS